MDEIKLKIYGETRTIEEWSQISGVSAFVIRRRHEDGWRAKDAVGTPCPSCPVIKDDLMAIAYAHVHNKKHPNYKYNEEWVYVPYSSRSGRYEKKLVRES